MEEAAFLRLIAAAPDDDAPRLIYADWLEERGDPRGSFIRVQCALARLAADDPRRGDLEGVERHLLAAYAATGRAGVFLARSTNLPVLTTLDLSNNRLDAAGVTALAHSKSLAKLADLRLEDNPLGDAGARALAGSPLLARQLARTG